MTGMKSGHRKSTHLVAMKLLLMVVTLLWCGMIATVAARVRTHKTMVQVISTNTRSGQVDMANALRLMPDSVDKTNAPDNIYHGAVAVFGKVYDFIAEVGIVTTDKARYYEENVPLWIDGTFLTTKTEPEFERWLKSQTKTKYTKTSYDLIDNNCLHFVADAVKFFGGIEPEKLRNQRIFAENNRNNVELLKGLAKAENVTLENFGSVRRP